MSLFDRFTLSQVNHLVNHGSVLGGLMSEAVWMCKNNGRNIIIKKVLSFNARKEVHNLIQFASIAPELLGCVKDNEQGVWYLICELIEGPTLAEYLIQGNDFPTDKIVDLVEKLVREGCMCYDLNFGNIIVQEKQLRLIDFGMMPGKSSVEFIASGKEEMSKYLMLRDINARLDVVKEQLKDMDLQLSCSKPFILPEKPHPNSKPSKRKACEINNTINENTTDIDAAPPRKLF